MNLMKEFNEEQIQLLNNAGVIIEDREYSNEELNHYEMEVMDFIMNHSSKNGEISKLNMEYDSILRTIAK